MGKIVVRKRYYAEVILAIIAASLGVLTAFWHDWIEVLTGLDPDAGDGSAEWLIVAGCFLAAAACGFLARQEYPAERRRLRLYRDS